jgi:endonuclease YncB( thermonuclease family)
MSTVSTRDRGHVSPEKYGRWLGVVTSADDNLNDALITAGLAAPYDGHGPLPVVTRGQ